MNSQQSTPIPSPQLTQEQAARIDAAMHADKQRDGYAHRQLVSAVRLEQSLPESLRGTL